MAGHEGDQRKQSLHLGHHFSKIWVGQDYTHLSPPDAAFPRSDANYSARRTQSGRATPQRAADLPSAVRGGLLAFHALAKPTVPRQGKFAHAVSTGDKQRPSVDSAARGGGPSSHLQAANTGRVGDTRHADMTQGAPTCAGGRTDKPGLSDTWPFSEGTYSGDQATSVPSGSSMPNIYTG